MCVSKSVYYSLSEEPFEDFEAKQSRDTHPHSDGEQSPTERWSLISAFVFVFFKLSTNGLEMKWRSFNSVNGPFCSTPFWTRPSFSNVFCSRPSSPKSDSELVVKPHDCSGPQIQWNWGGFPTVWPAHTESCGFTADSRYCRARCPIADSALRPHSCVRRRSPRQNLRALLISAPLRGRTPLTWAVNL